MPAAYFALTPDKYVWEALLKLCGPERAEELLDQALARLQTFLPRMVTATRDGMSIIVVHPQLPPDESAIESWALSLERAVSAEPYAFKDGHQFFPLPCAGVSAVKAESAERGLVFAKRAVEQRNVGAALAWHGTIETSRLALYSMPANIGGDDSCEIRVGSVNRVVARVERQGHHACVMPVGDNPRDPPHDANVNSVNSVLHNGRPLGPWRFQNVIILFIAPDRRGQDPSTMILFDSPSRAIELRTRDSLGDEQWACVALARAALTSTSSYGLIMLISREGKDVIDRWRKLILSVDLQRGKRDVSLTADGLAIVMEASASDIDNYAESLREAFFDEPVVVVSTRASANELPATILERARACARAMSTH